MKKIFFTVIRTSFAVIIAIIMFLPVLIIIGSSVKSLPDISSYPPEIFPSKFLLRTL